MFNKIASKVQKASEYNTEMHAILHTGAIFIVTGRSHDIKLLHISTSVGICIILCSMNICSYIIYDMYMCLCRLVASSYVNSYRIMYVLLACDKVIIRILHM